MKFTLSGTTMCLVGMWIVYFISRPVLILLFLAALFPYLCIFISASVPYGRSTQCSSSFHAPFQGSAPLFLAFSAFSYLPDLLIHLILLTLMF